MDDLFEYRFVINKRVKYIIITRSEEEAIYNYNRAIATGFYTIESFWPAVKQLGMVIKKQEVFRKEKAIMNQFLGHTYKDLITGYTGICTGFVEYITGCNQLLLTAKGDGAERKAEWFDQSRLQHVSKKRIVLDASKPLGFDVSAPVK